MKLSFRNKKRSLPPNCNKDLLQSQLIDPKGISLMVENDLGILVRFDLQVAVDLTTRDKELRRQTGAQPHAYTFPRFLSYII